MVTRAPATALGVGGTQGGQQLAACQPCLAATPTALRPTHFTGQAVPPDSAPHLCLLASYDGAHRHPDEGVCAVSTVTEGALACTSTPHTTQTKTVLSQSHRMPLLQWARGKVAQTWQGQPLCLHAACPPETLLLQLTLQELQLLAVAQSLGASCCLRLRSSPAPPSPPPKPQNSAHLQSRCLP